MPPLVQCKELKSSVGYSQVRSLQGSFGSHKEMFSAKLIEPEYDGQSCTAGVLNCNNALGASTTKSQTTGSNQMEV